MPAIVSVTVKIELSDDLVMKLANGNMSPQDLEDLLSGLRNKTTGDHPFTGDATPKKGTGPFTANFEVSDELFDASFGIDTTTGDFLGECGVSVSDGHPGVAFDVWMFDKNDIKTATKIWATPAGMEDPLYGELQVRASEVLPLSEGTPMTLETQSLVLTAVAQNIRMDGDTVSSVEFILTAASKD